MVMTCAICHRLYNKLLDVSFHSLPHDSRQRSLWLEICKIRETSQNMRICSAHFSPDSFVPRQKVGPKRLKPSAVPSLFLEITDRRKKPNSKSNFDDQSICFNKADGNNSLSQSPAKTASHLLDHDYMEVDATLPKEISLPEISDVVTESVTQALIKKEVISMNNNRKTSVRLPNHYRLHFETRSRDDEEDVSTTVEVDETPIMEQTEYLKTVDCNSDELSPQLAVQALYIARNKIIKQRRKIESLKAENLKLSDRVKTLQELLQHSIVIATPSSRGT